MAHARPHSLRMGRLEAPAPLMCTSSGREKKAQYPEKTHADVGRVCKLHTRQPQPGINFFFLHQHNKKTTFTKVMFCKDLLYSTVPPKGKPKEMVQRRRKKSVKVYQSANRLQFWPIPTSLHHHLTLKYPRRSVGVK